MKIAIIFSKQFMDLIEKYFKNLKWKCLMQFRFQGAISSPHGLPSGQASFGEYNLISS
jgi:hypothetical protein